MLLQPAAAELLGKEEVVASGDHAIETAPTGDAVVGVDLVVAPRVVRKDDVWLVLADHAADLTAQAHRDLELAVLLHQEHEALHPDGRARGALLALADLRHLFRRHLRIPGPLLAAGDDAVGHVRAAL